MSAEGDIFDQIRRLKPTKSFVKQQKFDVLDKYTAQIDFLNEAPVKTHRMPQLEPAECDKPNDNADLHLQEVFDRSRDNYIESQLSGTELDFLKRYKQCKEEREKFYKLSRIIDSGKNSFNSLMTYHSECLGILNELSTTTQKDFKTLERMSIVIEQLVEIHNYFQDSDELLNYFKEFFKDKNFETLVLTDVFKQKFNYLLKILNFFEIYKKTLNLPVYLIIKVFNIKSFLNNNLKNFFIHFMQDLSFINLSWEFWESNANKFKDIFEIFLQLNTSINFQLVVNGDEHQQIPLDYNTEDIVNQVFGCYVEQRLLFLNHYFKSFITALLQKKGNNMRNIKYIFNEYLSRMEKFLNSEFHLFEVYFESKTNYICISSTLKTLLRKLTLFFVEKNSVLLRKFFAVQTKGSDQHMGDFNYLIELLNVYILKKESLKMKGNSQATSIIQEFIVIVQEKLIFLIKKMNSMIAFSPDFNSKVLKYDVEGLRNYHWSKPVERCLFLLSSTFNLLPYGMFNTLSGELLMKALTTILEFDHETLPNKSIVVLWKIQQLLVLQQQCLSFCIQPRINYYKLNLINFLYITKKNSLLINNNQIDFWVFLKENLRILLDVFITSFFKDSLMLIENFLSMVSPTTIKDEQKSFFNQLLDQIYVNIKDNVVLIDFLSFFKDFDDKAMFNVGEEMTTMVAERVEGYFGKAKDIFGDDSKEVDKLVQIMLFIGDCFMEHGGAGGK
ncbi:hypothetical protein PCE1_000067 [Barthelona sp. PCE]